MWMKCWLSQFSQLWYSNNLTISVVPTKFNWSHLFADDLLLSGGATHWVPLGPGLEGQFLVGHDTLMIEGKDRNDEVTPPLTHIPLIKQTFGQADMERSREVFPSPREYCRSHGDGQRCYIPLNGRAETNWEQ